MRNLFSKLSLCRVGRLLVWATLFNLNIGWTAPLYALKQAKKTVKVTPKQKKQLAQLRSIMRVGKLEDRAVRPDYDCVGSVNCKGSSSDDCIELEEVLECLALLKELTGEPSGICVDDCDVNTIFGLLECIIQQVDAIDCDIDVCELKTLIKKAIAKACTIDSKVDILLDTCGGGGDVPCCDELNAKLDEIIEISIEIDEKVDEISEINEKIDDLSESVDGISKDVKITKTKVCTIETVVNKINSKIDLIESCQCGSSSSSSCNVCSSSSDSCGETNELVVELTTKVDELAELIIILGEKVDEINSCQCDPRKDSSSSSACCDSSSDCNVCDELVVLNEKVDETNSKVNSVDNKVNKIGQKVCTIETVVNKINSKIDDLDCKSSSDSGCCSSSSSDLACCEDLLDAVETVQQTLDELAQAQEVCCELIINGIGELDGKIYDLAQAQEACCEEVAEIGQDVHEIENKVNKINQKVCTIEVVVNKINSKIDDLDCKSSSDFGCCSSSSSSACSSSSSSSGSCSDSSSGGDLKCCKKVLSKLDEIAQVQEFCCEELLNGIDTVESKVDLVKQCVVIHDATNTAEHIIILNELDTIESKLDTGIEDIEQLIIDHDIKTCSKLDHINKKLCTIERKIDCLDRECSEDDICDQLHQLAEDVDTINTLLSIYDLKTSCELAKIQSCCSTLQVDFKETWTMIGDLCGQVDADPCAIFDPNAECFSLVEWLKLIYLKVK